MATKHKWRKMDEKPDYNKDKVVFICGRCDTKTMIWTTYIKVADSSKPEESGESYLLWLYSWECCENAIQDIKEESKPKIDYTKVYCKGSLRLGNACKACSKCFDELLKATGKTLDGFDFDGFYST